MTLARAGPTVSVTVISVEQLAVSNAASITGSRHPLDRCGVPGRLSVEARCGPGQALFHSRIRPVHSRRARAEFLSLGEQPAIVASDEVILEVPGSLHLLLILGYFQPVHPVSGLRAIDVQHQVGDEVTRGPRGFWFPVARDALRVRPRGDRRIASRSARCPLCLSSPTSSSPSAVKTGDKRIGVTFVQRLHVARLEILDPRSIGNEINSKMLGIDVVSVLAIRVTFERWALRALACRLPIRVREGSAAR